MRVCSISWNPKYEKIRINVTPEFQHSEWILKADILQDAIYELTDLYNHVLTEKTKLWHKEMDKKLSEGSVKLSTS